MELQKLRVHVHACMLLLYTSIPVCVTTRIYVTIYKAAVYMSLYIKLHGAAYYNYNAIYNNYASRRSRTRTVCVHVVCLCRSTPFFIYWQEMQNIYFKLRSTLFIVNNCKQHNIIQSKLITYIYNTLERKQNMARGIITRHASIPGHS